MMGTGETALRERQSYFSARGCARSVAMPQALRLRSVQVPNPFYQYFLTYVSIFCFKNDLKSAFSSF